MLMRCRSASDQARTAGAENKHPAVIGLPDPECLEPVVHPAQAVSNDAHHLQGKIRRLLHQKLETFFVDFNEPAGGFCDGTGTARHIVQQGHLAQNAAGPEVLDQSAFDQKIDFAFDNDIHGIAAVAFVKDGLTRRNGECVCFVAENLDRDQLASPCAGRRVNMKKL